MKKVISMLLIIVLCLNIVLCNASAATTGSFSASSGSAKPGDSFTVTLSLNNNPGIAYLKAYVGYDSGTLKLVSVNNGSIWGSVTKGQSLSVNPQPLVFSSESDKSDNGTLATLTFQVLSDAKVLSDTTVSVRVSEAYNQSTEDVSVSVANGTYKILCPHKNTTTVKGTPATCTTDGITDGVYCNDCKTYISQQTTIAATGHKYDNDCDPACNVCGEKRNTSHNYSTKWSYDKTYHYHTCTKCGNKIDKEKHTFDENGICTVCGANLTNLIDDTVDNNEHSHEFGGWLYVKGTDEKADTICFERKCECGEVETITLPNINTDSITINGDSTGSVVGLDKEFIASILTDEEIDLIASGEELKLYFEASDISGSISEEEKKIVDSKLDSIASNSKSQKAYVGTYLNVSLYKQIGSNKQMVPVDNKKMTVTISVPDKLLNKNSSIERTFKIVYLHDGKETILEGKYDKSGNEIIFDTDGCSDFALVCCDANNSSTSLFIFIGVGIAAIAVIVAALFLIRKRKKSLSHRSKKY